jgi:hypothetical protein
MTIVPFDPQDTMAHYDEYYRQQIGGGGAVYAGRTIMDMRGAGIGAFLGTMFKKAAPALLNAAKSVGRTVGKQAVNVARDVINGGDFAESATRGLRAAGGEVLGDVFDAVTVERPAKRRRAPPLAKKTKRRRRADKVPLLDD